MIDFTPELRAEALEVVKRYRIGPIYHAARARASRTARSATLMLPADVGGANWPGGAFDPETNRLYIHSHTAVYSLPNIVPADPASIVRHIGCAGAGGRGAAGRGRLRRRRRGAGWRGAAPVAAAGGRGRSRAVLAARGGPAAGGRGGTTVQGLPLVKPPYDRITAYDMNSGDMLWQKAHSSTPDDIKNHPALKGLDLPRLGQPGRTFIGVLATKTLVIAGDGGVHTNAKGETRCAAPRLRQGHRRRRPGEVIMPAKQTGSPMTYMHNGKQYIVIAVSGATGGAELIAYALPQ